MFRTYGKSTTMARKKIIRIALILVGVFVLLSATLVAHIYMVTSEPVVNSSLNLSRIDVEDSLSKEDVAQLKSKVSAIPGVHKTYINADAGTIVYGYYNDQQNPDAVFASLSSSTDYRLTKFEVSEEDLAKGCPAFDESSITFKVGAFVQNVIH